MPPGLEQAPQFEDGKIQTVKSGTEQWYVYDVQYEMENGQEFYIRGVVSVTETQKEFLIAVRFAVILLPWTVRGICSAESRRCSPDLPSRSPGNTV